MKTEKRVISVWFIIICFIAILLYMQSITQLSFINNQYNFYTKIVLIISFFVSLNKSLFKNINFLEITSVIICIIFISLISLYHIFFEDLIYMTEIDLNNNDRNLIVKEQGIMGEYNIYFYEKRFLLLKKPLYNGKYIVTDNAPFYSGEYKTEYDKDNKVLIKYRNSRFEEYQEITIQL